jgi:hypothetical protein
LRHIQLHTSPTPTAMGQSFIMTLYIYYSQICEPKKRIYLLKNDHMSEIRKGSS